MCNPIRNGGRRCPIHRHEQKGAIRLSSELSGLTMYQTERLFSELRREGRNAAPITDEQRAASRQAILDAAADTDVADKVAAEFAASDLNENENELDGATAYAQRLIVARAKERGDKLKERLVETANRTGLSYTEVKALYTEFLQDISHDEYNQNTRRRAVLDGLPYDRASVVAIEKLRALTGSERRRRVDLVPGPEGSHIHSYGYSEGRLEVAFRSNPDNVYAYHNVPEGVWENMASSSNPGSIYARQIRGNEDYTYASAEEAEADGYNTRCASCGQFRASAHSCPQRERRNELEAEGLSAAQIATTLATEATENEAIIDGAEAAGWTTFDSSDLDALRARLAEPDEEITTEVVKQAATLTGDLPTSNDTEETEAEEAVVPEAEASTFVLAAAEVPAVQPFTVVKPEKMEDTSAFSNFLAYPEDSVYAAAAAAEVTKDSQLVPTRYDEASLMVAEGEGFAKTVIVNAENFTSRMWGFGETGISPELKEEIMAAPTNVHYVLSKNADEVVTLHKSYDSNIYTGSTNSIYGGAANGYAYTYNYKIKRRGLRAELTSYDSPEARDAAVNEEDTKLQALVDSGVAVKVAGNTTGSRKFVFDASRGDHQPKITAGKVNELRRAFKDGKVAIMPVKIEMSDYAQGTGVDDQGYTISHSTSTTIYGEVAMRQREDGTVETISTRKLRCSCNDYRRKYYCAHVNYAERHVSNVGQQMARANTLNRAERDASMHRIMTTGLAARGDVTVIEPEEEGAEPYFSFGDTLNHSRTEHSYNVRRRLIAPARLVEGMDNENPTSEQLAALVEYSNTVNSLYQINTPASPGGIRTALRRGDAQVPVSAYFSSSYHNGQYVPSVNVSGTVTIGQERDNLEGLTTRSRNLQCDCADYRANYDCRHVRLLADQPFAIAAAGSRQEATANRFNNVMDIHRARIAQEEEILNMMNRMGVNREEAVVQVAAAAEAYRIQQEAAEREREARRAERERVYAEQRRAAAAALEETNRETIANYQEFRKNQLDRWKTIEGTEYSKNPEAFYNAAEAALARKKAGENPIPFRTENVTDGICGSDPGARKFGVEIEFDIKQGVNRAEALRKIGRELHEAGLTGQAAQTHYHSARATGWQKWSFEQDCTVSGELVSPLMSDTPEDWKQLEKACEIINRNGGVATTRTGSHVHVSTGSYELSTAKHAELLRTINQNEDTMYRMATAPARGTHRRGQWCGPNTSDSHDDISDDVKDGHQILRGASSSHNVMLNFEGTSQSEFKKSHIEYRMWDGTLDASVIQQQVAISAAITDYAERTVIQNKGSKKPEGARQKVGTHKVKEAAALAAADSKKHTKETFASTNASAAEFIDKLFRRDEDRAAAAALFAVTNWQKA